MGKMKSWFDFNRDLMPLAIRFEQAEIWFEEVVIRFDISAIWFDQKFAIWQEIVNKTQPWKFNINSLELEQ